MRTAGGITLGTVFGLSAALAWAQGAPTPEPKPAPKAPEAARAAEGRPDPKAAEFFEKQIRPLLSQQCFTCHSGAKPQGALKMDTPADFFKGGPSGPLVVPGDPEKSLLIQAVHYTKEFLKMPPGGKLKPQQIALLAEWVKMGAPWPGAVQSPKSKVQSGGSGEQAAIPYPQSVIRHWAFQPVKRPALPAVKDRAWVKSPIDAFVLAKLEAKGLKPAPPADRRTLIRRVTFDLTGLPPTPEEIDAFLKDSSPGAFAKVVDRLLASPAYGERWARHWLDVARYADSNGLDENTAFGPAWRYRDYVVDSFNRDKPYDQFVREQLAGDLLPRGDDRTDREQLTATGFLSLGPKVLAEPDKQKMVMDIVDEQIDTVGKAFMGLTLGCARCHNHKFDPLPTQDYYALAGIFKSTRTMATLNTVARVLERPLADKAAVAALEAHTQKLQAKEEELRLATVRRKAEASAAVVRDLPRYLLLGLQVDVAPSQAGRVPDLGAPGTVVLEAEKFTRGNAQADTTGYGKGIGIIQSAGQAHRFTEYEFTLPRSGDYQLSARYASADSRPVKLSIDGREIKDDACAEVTGGFNPPEQQWYGEAVVSLEAGKHLLRVDQVAGSLPHLDKIALEPLSGAAPAAPARPRSAKATDLAKAHSLDADLLRRSAAYLLGAQQHGDRIWEPFFLLAELPEAGFQEAAQKRVAEWQASGKLKTWHPAVAALFAGEAPKTLAEAAERYGALFQKVDASWVQALRKAKKAPQRLNDGDQEALRQFLYGPRSAFGLEKAERLYSAEARVELAKLKGETEALQKSAPPPVPMVLAVEEAGTVENVKVHVRGNHLNLGEEVPRRFPLVLAGLNQAPVAKERSGRLELAEWLTRPDHPLTGRVMVNRIWQHHFGGGIVRTPDNFGKLGEAPTHPELLDWLASTFVGQAASSGSDGETERRRDGESKQGSRPSVAPSSGLGWSMKKFHRLLLLSNAYQMSTAHDAKAALADPENRLLWRFNRQRVEVEAIRDSMLAVSGNLDRTMGGSLLMTPDYGYVTNDQSGNAAQYDAPRRSLYLPVIRNAVFDVFQVFDFVEPSLLSGDRATTTVAPQALFLLNGQFVMKQARAWAEGLLAGEGADEDRVRKAYLQAYGRPPVRDEVEAAVQYLKQYEGRLAEREPDAGKRRLTAWASFCQVLFASSEFVYVN